MPALPLPIKLDRSRHAAPQVFEQLRERILALDLAPGTVLSRADLAAQFGVSQTPVREALIKLGQEGLVDIFPQHATVVSKIGLAAAREAHFLRRAVELEVVATLAAPTAPTDKNNLTVPVSLAGLAHAEVDALVIDLRQLITQQSAANRAGDAAAFIATDRAFHQRMLDAAGVPDLADLIRQRSGHVDRLRRLHLPAKGKMQAIVADHRRIVDAIAARDPVAAQRALRDHLSGTLSQVEEIRQRYGAFVAE